MVFPTRQRTANEQDVYESDAELNNNVTISSQNWVDALLPCLPRRIKSNLNKSEKVKSIPASHGCNRERTPSSSTVSSSDSDETKSLLSIEKMVSQEKAAALSKYKQLKKQVDYLRVKIRERREKRKTFAEGKLYSAVYLA